MEISQAIELCKRFGDGVGIDSFLEILQEMQMLAELDELSNINEVAFRTVMRHGAAMFAPVEA